MDKNEIIFFFICIIMLFEVIFYFYPTVYFPIYSQKRNISQTQIGIVMGSITPGILLISIFYSKYLSQISPKNKYMSILLIMIVSFLLFGLSDYIKNNTIFLIVNIFSRFIQGFYSGLSYTLGYKLIPKLFESNVEIQKRIKITSMSQSLGGLTCHSLGYFFIYIAGYVGSFFLLCLLTFIILIILIIYFPNKIENIYSQEKKIEIELLEKSLKEEMENSENNLKNINDEKVKISFLQIFKSRNLFLLIIYHNIIGISSFIFIPGFSKHLYFSYNLSLFNISLINFLSQISRLIFILIIMKIKPNPKIYLVLNPLIIMISCILIGPYTYFYESAIILTIIGFFLIIISWTMLLNAFFPLLIEESSYCFTNFNSENIAVKFSVLNSLMVAISDALGPLFGGILFDYFGFSKGNFIWGIFILITFVIFILCFKNHN